MIQSNKSEKDNEWSTLTTGLARAINTQVQSMLKISSAYYPPKH